MASLVERLRKAKANLQSVETKILRGDGQELTEKRNPDGTYKVCHSGIRPWGFIGDLTPDLQVGKVTEGLYVGSQDVAGDLELLKLLNITHILNVATYVPNHYPDTFVYKNISILDLPSEDIKSSFHESCQFIEEAISSQGTVLVHCNAGISRSSTLVAAYLIKNQRLGAQNAVEMIQLARPRVRPNDGFQLQLEQFEKELEQESSRQTFSSNP